MTTPVALITAGSAGLGAATAKAFAAMGLRVAINYSNDASRAECLVEELGKIALSSDRPFGQQFSNIEPIIVANSDNHVPNMATRPQQARRFISIRADVSSRSEIDRLVSTTIQEMGRLDIVFSNHGWTRLTNFSNLDENVDEEDWDRCWNMNVKSHLWLFRAARRYLEASEVAGGGCFVSTSSVAGVAAMGSSLVSVSHFRRAQKLV